MRALVPRNALFHELADFRRDFDQMFNRFFNLRSPQEEQTLTEGFVPAIETSIDKDGKKFQCQVMLPGVDPKDVNIQVLGNTLSISGERSSSRETKESDYLHREITYGTFQRPIELPEGRGQGQAHGRISQRRVGDRRARFRCRPPAQDRSKVIADRKRRGRMTCVACRNRPARRPEGRFENWPS